MNVAVITNDKALPGYEAEHGLSLYIIHPLYNLLFDTGQSSIYLNNAEKLGLSMEQVDYIVLSHGHYDHMGGLIHFPYPSHVKKIIIHQDAFLPKYANEIRKRPNGVPYKKTDLSFEQNQFVNVKQFATIAPHFHVISDIAHPVKQDKYYVNDTLDDFHDEMILVLEEENQLSLFMGCSHFGVRYGIERIKKAFPNRRIKNIFAGMHLRDASMKDIVLLGDYLATLDFDLLVPLHCTGEHAMNYFKDRFQDKCKLMLAGETVAC